MPFFNSASFQIQRSEYDSVALSNLDCGQLQVSLNWSNPARHPVNPGFTRMHAIKSEERTGSLTFNPSSLGGSTTKSCEAQACGIEVFAGALTSHFDMICPAPRDIDISNPIPCSADSRGPKKSRFPRDQAFCEEMIQSNRALGQSCLESSGDIFKNMGTVSAVKDVEAIRLAVDDGN